MPFRAPRKFWEWVLLFSPAIVIWVGTAIGSTIPAHGDRFPILFGALYSSFAAILVSFVGGYVFTEGNPERAVRHSSGVLAAVLIAAMNLVVAFAGCALVLG